VLSTPAVQAVGERQFLIAALWLIAVVAVISDAAGNGVHA